MNNQVVDFPSAAARTGTAAGAENRVKSTIPAVAAARFVQWCHGAGIVGRQTWPQLAQYYLCEYLEATGEPQISATQLQRGLGQVCEERGMSRVPQRQKDSLRRIRGTLRAFGWPVASCEDSADERVRWYALPQIEEIPIRRVA